MPGVLALLRFHREWRDGDDAIEVDYLSCLVESIETALLELHPAAGRV